VFVCLCVSVCLSLRVLFFDTQVVQYILATFFLSCLRFLWAYVHWNYITLSTKSWIVPACAVRGFTYASQYLQMQ